MVETGSNELEDVCITLVTEVRQGAAGAWERMVSTFERLVWAVPLEMGFSRADCEEVFQATWISLHGAIERLERPGGLAAWLVTTTRRHCWRLRRGRSTQPLTAEQEERAQAEDLGPAEQAIALETRLRVQRGVEQLSERCRDLLQRLYFASREESYAAISEQTGMPIGSIGPTRMRCLADLARKLEGEEGEEA